MNEEPKFSEESLRKIAEQKIKFRKSVWVHALIFGLVNAFLVLLNVLLTPDFYWVTFPILGWLIGVMMHLTAYAMYAKGVYPFAKRAVIFHIVSYIFVNLLLAAANFLTSGSFTWIIWPVACWGIGLIAHIVVYTLYGREKLPKKEGEQPKSKKELAIEREMQKMKQKAANQ